MPTYLVTGAAGFIGSKLAERFILQGHDVVAIDNLSTGFKENMPPKVQFYEGDCQDENIYKTIPDVRYDAIFHLAGQSSGEVSFDDPAYDLRTNTESTLHLLKFALEVECKRFIYAGTMSVYGVRPDRPVKEDAELKPESFYGVGKIASEHYMRLFEQYGIRSTSLRLFNVYGPGQNMANLRQGMVSIFMAQMLENNHIVVKGSKDRYRDFVYIDDVVDAFLACLSSLQSHGRVINIATGLKTTVEELIQKMTALYPKEVKVEYSGSTLGDIHGIYADISLARATLSYKPKTSLDEGLEKMLEWAISG
jgi:UDP-glucose 4-epimerase